jgi:hypothetical protein
MHLIFKSSLAKGSWSFRYRSNAARIEALIVREAARFGVQLIRYSNNFNHLHLHVKFGSRELYKKFVKSVSGQVAMLITGACKSRSLRALLVAKSGASKSIKFWDARPFTRIIRGWRGFKIADDYVRLNQLEAEQVIPKRDTRLRGVKIEERQFFIRRKNTVERNSQTEQTQSVFVGL